MCWCSQGIIIMKHAPFVPSHSLSLFSSLFHYSPAFVHQILPLFPVYFVICPFLVIPSPLICSLPSPEVPVSSVLCLSSVRELPVQVRDLYAQGFVLVAVHPFVHPCGPRHAHIQRQLHRAVLVRETPRYTN